MLLKYGSPVLLTLLMASNALGDTRYGCMAADENLKMAVHVEYSGELGGKLSHLTGRLSLLSEKVPHAVRELALNSNMLTQTWADKDQVMLRLENSQMDGQPVNIAFSTKAVDGYGTRLQGNYRVDQPDEKGPGFQLEGALYCQLDFEGPTALPGPISKVK